MISSLTTLRWFAALYVFLFHIQMRAELTSSPVGSVLISGYTGMTFFFVLSGFVLAYRYVDSSGTYSSFVISRLARIYPAFLVAFLLSIPTIDGVGSELFALNFGMNLTLQQAWTPNLFSLGINSGTWSLSAEMFFYLLFPVARPLILSSADRASKLWMMLAVFWVLSFLPGLVEYLLPLPGSTGFYYSSPIYRLPEFLVGITIADLWRGGHLKRLSGSAVFGAASAFASICVYTDGMKGGSLTLLNLVAIPFFGSLIAWSAKERPTFLEWRPLVYLGEISYGIYIYQLTFLVSLYPVLKKAALGSYTIAILGLVFSCALASLSFHFLERPVRAFVRSALKSRRGA